MNEKPKSTWQKSRNLPRPFWIVIVLLFVVCLLLSLTMLADGRYPSSVLTAATVISGAASLYLFIRWLCHWRTFKRFLFVTVCLATLIALFYAEENWRGRHAWEKYRQEQEAKGEKFSLKDFIPPLPPNDQNFATTPVIASCYESMIDTTGHEVRPHLTNVVNRLEMPITAEDDKHVPTNGYWAKGTTTDLSAWQTYYRQLAASTNLFPVPPTPQTPAADVLLALSKYNPTFEEVRAASRLPYAQFPLEYDKDDPAAILLPHLARMKGLSRLLQLRALAELQAGQSDQALEDIQLTFYLVKSIHVEPFLISHLVRIAMTEINLQPVYEGLAGHRWTDLQLSALDAELANLDFLADFEYSMRGERICHVSILDYLRHTRSVDMFTGSESSSSPHPLESVGLYLLPAGFFDQTKVYFSRLHDQWVFPVADTTLRIISPAKVHENEVALTNSLQHFSIQNRLASLLFPSLLPVTKRFAREQSSVDLARVAIALERYRLAHGEYPDSLDPLAPQFINPVPHDIINGHPLNYRRTADGLFVLYSVGWNEKDDGGARGTGPDSTRIFDTGDLVWSYSPK